MVRLIPSINRILFSLQALRFGKVTLKILTEEFNELEKKKLFSIKTKISKNSMRLSNYWSSTMLIFPMKTEKYFQN